MRLEFEPGIVRVTLSRRNLLTGLHKLGMDGSARTTYKQTDHGLLILQYEDDSEHYYNRPEGGPGMMHPETEAFIVGRAVQKGQG